MPLQSTHERENGHTATARAAFEEGDNNNSSQQFSSSNNYFYASSMSLSSIIVNHTWSIHAISPLTQYSLRGSAWQLQDKLGRDVCIGNDYCRIRWITTSSTSSSSAQSDDKIGSDLASTQATSRFQGPSTHTRSWRREDQQRYKRSATSSDDWSVTSASSSSRLSPYQENRHLLIELYVKEKLSAAIVLCFVQVSRHRLSEIGFCLVRGTRLTYQVVWDWLELQTGCAISRQPIQFTPCQLAQCVANWTLKVYHDRQQELSYHRQQHFLQLTQPHGSAKGKSRSTRNDASSISSNTLRSRSSTSLTRPLVLTFVPPLALQGRGLDTVSTVVTPSDLDALCRDLEECRPSHLPNSRNDADDDDDNDLEYRRFNSSKKRSRISTTTTNPRAVSAYTGTSTSSTSESQLLPILNAIVTFVSNEIGLHLHNFDVTQASCSIAALGIDGRCQPLSETWLNDCWVQILHMISQRRSNTIK